MSSAAVVGPVHRLWWMEFIVGSALSMYGAGVFAQSSQTNPAPTGEELNEVVVTGHYDFLSADTSGATNLPLPIEKVPQSISLVSSDFIKASDLKTLGEIAQYTPGAADQGSHEGFATNIVLRGFPALESFDGLNVGVLTNNRYEPDYAIIDRLEIVKGPASVTYGVSSPGGLVNFVTKSATDKTVDYVSAQVGMWSNYRVEGQMAGALNADGTVRAIGVVVRDQGKSFENDFNHATTILYGGVNAAFGSGVEAYLHGGYEVHQRTSFDGIPTEADGSPAPVSRSFCICASDMQLWTDVMHEEGGLTWHASDMLEFNLKENFRKVDSHGTAPYSFGLDASGNVGIAIQDFQSEESKDYGVGASGIYHLDDVGLKDSFVSVAALYQDDVYDVNQGQGVFSGQYAGSDPTNPYVGTANLFAGQAAIGAAFDSAQLTGTTDIEDIELKTLTLSTQSVVTIIDHLSVLAGASYAKPKISNIQDGVSLSGSSASQVSYRGALTEEFLPGANAYVSFSQSFNPQILTDINGNVLPPLIGKQYEAGIKYRTVDGRLLLTGAVYQITQTNAAEFDEQVDGFDRYKAIGEVTNKGVELQALGQITRQWQINAGYSYLDPKVTKDPDPTTVGQTQLFLSQQTASLFTTYTLDETVLRGLSVGGGARYIGPQKTSFDGSTGNLPGYTLADLTLGYTLDSWLMQINAHNIFDKHYYINTYQTLFYGNTVGAPANIALTVRHNF
jgi:outer membrane receptor for ferric coprogen and ferric-rhodotorulic acid